MIFQSSGLGENFSIFGAIFVFLFYDLQSISKGASLNLPSWHSKGSKPSWPGYGLFKKQFSRLPILENFTFWMPCFLMFSYFWSSGMSRAWISISGLLFSSICAWATNYFSIALSFHVVSMESMPLPLLPFNASLFYSLRSSLAFSKSFVSFRDLYVQQASTFIRHYGMRYTFSFGT